MSGHGYFARLGSTKHFGLLIATRAAYELQLGGDAVALAQRLVEMERTSVGEGEGSTLLGGTLLLDGALADGLTAIRAGIKRATSPRALVECRQFVRLLGRKLSSNADVSRHLTELDVDFAEAGAAMTARFGELTDGDQAAFELKAASDNSAYDEVTAKWARLASELASPWCALAAQDADGLEQVP